MCFRVKEHFTVLKAFCTILGITSEKHKKCCDAQSRARRILLESFN